MNPLLLGVNIDHVATIRQARGTDYPSVLEAARVAEAAGAEVELVVKRGKGHGWVTMVWDLRRLVAFFDEGVIKLSLGKKRHVLLSPTD